MVEDKFQYLTSGSVDDADNNCQAISFQEDCQMFVYVTEFKHELRSSEKIEEKLTDDEPNELP